MTDQKLGYTVDSVWIRFQGNISQFPLDVQISECAKYHLEHNDWTYTEGNGCGTTLSSRILLRLINSLYNVDLTPVCNLHDLEYSLDTSVDKSGCVKTLRRKLFADMALEYNIIEYCRRQRDVGHGVSIVAFFYMLAVRLAGTKSYWGEIPKNNRL